MSEEKPKKKHKVRRRILIVLATIVALVVVGFAVFIITSPSLSVMFNINLEEKLEHVSFNIEDGEGATPSDDYSTVYFTSDISPEGIEAIYRALGREATGNVAVKLSTGEAGNDYHLDPNLIKDLVHEVNGTIVECNTAYPGQRNNTAMHMQVAEDHGFTAIADVNIMDDKGSMSIPVVGGTHLTEDIVGIDLQNYDFIMVLSHFKGHPQGGFGGALKNISIGIATPEGKALIHTAGANTSSIFTFGISQNAFIESMAEAAKAVSDYENNGENMLYISVMNNLSVDCDCIASPAAPDMSDIGILASLNPVALDQACVDLIYKAHDGHSVIDRMESRNGIQILKHAEEIGLGNRAYELVSIDD